jgi:hypothetical protein
MHHMYALLSQGLLDLHSGYRREKSIYSPFKVEFDKADHGNSALHNRGRSRDDDGV